MLLQSGLVYEQGGLACCILLGGGSHLGEEFEHTLNAHILLAADAEHGVELAFHEAGVQTCVELLF